MKTTRFLIVMIISIIASFVFITGCDSGGSDDSSPWTIVNPSDGV